MKRKNEPQKDSAPVYKPDYNSWETEMHGRLVKNVENIMDNALDRFFVTTSPHNSSEQLGVIRLEDLYAIVCEELGVAPEETNYSAYAK